MQPYRQAAPNHYLPIYWNCHPCSCQHCTIAQNSELPSTSSAASKVRRPSFTIDYLLSDDEQKPFKQRSANAAMVSPCVSHLPGPCTKDGSHVPFHSPGYLSTALPRRPSLGVEKVGFVGGGSMQPNGAFLSHSEETDWSHQKPKRMRTIFTVEQLERLEREFTRQQYMVGGQRFYLSKELGLTETQVKVWFQNRRIKWRKQIIEQQRNKVRHQHETNANTQIEKNVS